MTTAEELGVVSTQFGLSSSKVLERELGRLMKQDPLLKQLMGGEVAAFTAVAEDTPMPYIVYNETRLDEWDTDTTQGGEHTILLQVWSDRESEAFIKEVLYAIRKLFDRLERTTFSISPYRLVMMDFQLQDVVRESDGQAFYGTVQFRALTGGGR